MSLKEVKILECNEAAVVVHKLPLIPFRYSFALIFTLIILIIIKIYSYIYNSKYILST
jgi:predicted permease